MFHNSLLKKKKNNNKAYNDAYKYSLNVFGHINPQLNIYIYYVTEKNYKTSLLYLIH